MATKFAPAERSIAEELLNEKATIDAITQFGDLLNALPYVAAILNSRRQIIYSNNVLLESIGKTTIDEILGMRPGEALSCVNAHREEGGCGTSEYCKVCGAVRAIVESQQLKQKIVKECRITSVINNEEISADYLVSATPFRWEGKAYTILTLNDISHEKRRKVLEKIFFHDIINKAGSLSGFLDMLRNTDVPGQIKEYLRLAGIISDELTGEILAQKSLLEAESGDLEVEFKNLLSLDLVKNNVSQMIHHPVADKRNIEIDPSSENLPFYSDMLILNRMLLNMLKNALEATPEKEKIIIGCNKLVNGVIFWVHNSSEMPGDVKLQVFQRSFSTKGANRGLGTYSIKLLGERYLKGKAYFKSEKGFGTRFYLELPLKPLPDNAGTKEQK
ncbi:MAG: HAMP domain-containing histidine kinase [Bacteroidales bacterium]|nr:HAMP domain-containing histidine kinase [Bacteroidales bacterium]